LKIQDINFFLGVFSENTSTSRFKPAISHVLFIFRKVKRAITAENVETLPSGFMMIYDIFPRTSKKSNSVTFSEVLIDWLSCIL